MPGQMVTAYETRIRRHEIEPDPAQAAVVARLDDLADALTQALNSQPRRFALFKKTRAVMPRGLYIHGAVGRGKTMLMDLFYDALAVPLKRRIHFHAFMAETHDRIARGRATTDGDPIPFVAAEIAGEAPILCFDEFHVTDIADAMILGRLFKGLFARDVVVVATSNSPPDRLYWNGLNRQLFLPFIAELEAHMDVLELRSAKDYRLDKLAGRKLYLTPANDDARIELNNHWLRLTGGSAPHSCELDVKGRKLAISKSAAGVARFDFAELCGLPLGAADYLEIARTFHTILIDDIPVLTPDRRNEARRFITLIDTLYDRGVCLIASAAAEPHELYPYGDGSDLFVRTASRLIEMRSDAYLAGRSRQTGLD